MKFELSKSFVLIVGLLACAESSSAQLKSVGRPVTGELQVSIDKIDHSSFNRLLKTYVNEQGEVNYAQWKNSVKDLSALHRYLGHLSQANPKLPASRSAKLAFWINAYNSVTLAGILDVYPTTTIRDHTRTFGYNIWKDLKLKIGNGEINLNDIEHAVLRKMDEPRIHFAIVCASVGCPRLLNQAYVAQDLERQLVENSRDFFSHKRNLYYDRESNRIYLSAILQWFDKDFGPDQKAQMKTIVRYFPAELKSVVENGEYTVGYQKYNWNLNSQ